MKKQILSIALLTFLSSAVLLTGCKKDEEEPVITLTGGASQTFALGDATDAGATVEDNKDDGLTATSNFATIVKKDEVNTYSVTYTASDEAGNEATATKTVIVESSKLAGSYSCEDIVTGSTVPSFPNGNWGYDVTVTQSSTTYNKLLIENFGGFGSGFSVYATVTGTAITIPSQTVTQPGTGGATITVSGSGTYSGANKKILTFNYSTDGYGNGVVTLTKQ